METQNVVYTSKFRTLFINDYLSAIRDGDLEKVKNIIIKFELDPNFESCLGLQESARSGKIDLVKHFLSVSNNDLPSLKCAFRASICRGNEDCSSLISQKIKTLIEDIEFTNNFEKKHYYYTQLLSEVLFMKEKGVNYSDYF